MPADQSMPADLAPALRKASALINDKTGTQIGTATFSETTDNKVRVVVDITKATPGKHGLHIHETGKCEGTVPDMGDFATAGGHFNPTGMMHGAPTAAMHHAGDFGNLDAMMVGADGKGTLELTTADIVLTEGAKNSVLGLSIIFHAAQDDLMTQPTGNSGGRVGCGLITLNK